MSSNSTFNSPILNRIARRAKVLRREKQIPLSEAYELASKEAGYSSWHHCSTTLKDLQLPERPTSARFQELLRQETLTFVTQSGTSVRDPLTGFSFHSVIPEDVERAKELRVLHRLFVEAHPEVPIPPYEAREKIKEEGRSLAQNSAMSIEQRANGAEMVMKCWYARSVEAWLHLGFESLYEHPGYHEYACHLWQSNKDDPKFDRDESLWAQLAPELNRRFKPIPLAERQIPCGRTYWEPRNRQGDETMPSSDRANERPSRPSKISTRRGVAFGSPLSAKVLYRPGRRMPIEVHEKAAKLILSVYWSGYNRDGVRKPLDLVRYDLDEWVQREYSYAELDNERFHEMYYGDRGEPASTILRSLSTAEYAELSKSLGHLQSLVEEHYEPCKPRDEVLRNIAKAKSGLDRWHTASLGNRRDERKSA